MTPSREPPASPFAINIAVVGALLLRDMKTRAGTSFLGYFMMMVVPMLHVGAVVTIYRILGRQIPVGNDSLIYLSLSVLPFVIFLYPSRQITVSIANNRPLLSFPRVKILDIIIARGVLEFFTGCTVTMIICLTVMVAGSEINPRDPAGAIFAIFSTIYFGFSVGMINALIASILPIWGYAFSFMAPVFWISSGILFFPDAVPVEIRKWLSYNPLMHCIEWLRYSWFEYYPSTVLDIPYLLLSSTALICLALVTERIFKEKFLTK